MSRRRAGFTLIELLLVVFILAIVAGSAASVIENEDLQVRHDQTKDRLETIRQAILGRTAAQTPSGYVADVGALPATLADLINPAPAPAGWRGPYLRTLDAQFADGWGNAFVWTPPPLPTDDLTITSYGADGVAGSAGGIYDVDSVLTIVRDDHQVNVRDWVISITIISASSQNVRLRLQNPGEALGDTVMSDGQPVSATESTVMFRFPATDRWIPCGQRRLVLVNAANDGVALSSIGLDLWPRAALPSSLPAPWKLP